MSSSNVESCESLNVMTLNWQMSTLDSAPLQIIDGDRGKAYPKSDDYSSEGHCLFLNAGNVTAGGFLFSECQFISEPKDDELRKGKLSRNDVILTTRGTLGNAALYGDDIDFGHIRINSGMVILRADSERLLPAFLYGFLRSPSFQDQVEQLRSGVAQPQLPIRDLSKINIPLPPVHVQRNIVDVFSSYDDLIKNNRRRMALLEESARLLYREWFVRLRFPGHEHTPIVDGVPQGWERVPLEAALVLQRGFDLPTQDRQEGDVPIYGSTGILGYHDKAKAVAPGVVTGRSGTLGEVQYVADDYWPLNTSLWVKEFKRVTPLFALFLLREMDLKQFNGGASVPTLDRKSVHRVEILIPPPPMLRSFHEFAADVYGQIKNLTVQNQKLRTARDLLLPRLMSGELAV